MSNDNSEASGRNSDANASHQHGNDDGATNTQPTINRRKVLLGTTAIGAAAALPLSQQVSTAVAQGAPTSGASTNPLVARTGFKGVIKLDARDSTPDWAPFTPNRAPDGSPNVLIVLYDDTGMAAWSPMGGAINMPTLQKLADNGLMYSQWHTTALCSPTRSTFLTGRNHHLNGNSCITEAAQGFPGRLRDRRPSRSRNSSPANSSRANTPSAWSSFARRLVRRVSPSARPRSMSTVRWLLPETCERSPANSRCRAMVSASDLIAGMR